MQVDFDAVLTNLAGEAMQIRVSDGAAELMTLKRIATDALLAEEQGVTSQAKLARFALALRVHEARGSLDLTPEDATLIRDRIGALYPPLIVGRALALLV